MQLMFSENIHIISGVVINNQGLAIENVIVKIEELNLWEATDASGYFTLEFSDPGSYDVTFKHIGYIDTKQKLDSRTKEIKVITLKMKSLPNDEVVITATRKETSLKNSPILTHVINQNEIKETITFAKRKAGQEFLHQHPGKVYFDPKTQQLAPHKAFRSELSKKWLKEQKKIQECTNNNLTSSKL